MYTGNLQPSAPASATNADDKHELFNDAESDDAHRSEEARTFAVYDPRRRSRLPDPRLTRYSSISSLPATLRSLSRREVSEASRHGPPAGQVWGDGSSKDRGRGQERRAAAERERLEATADPNLIPLGARAGIKGGMASRARAQPPSWTRCPTRVVGRHILGTEATTTCRTGDGT